MSDSQMLNADRAQLFALLAKAQSELSERSDPSQRQSAVNNARKALTYDPANGEAYAVLGIGLAGLGQFDEARRHCDNAVRLRPADAEVRWYLGRILDQQGRNDEAIDALKKAIDLTPKDYRIHRAIAAAYYHRGIKGGPSAGQDLSTALREYDITLRLSPGDAEILVLSGQVIEAGAKIGAEIQIGSVRQPATVELALNRYKSAVQMNDKLISAWLALGLLSASMGHAEDVKMAVEKLTALGDPASAALVTKVQPTAQPTSSVPAPIAAPAAPVTTPEVTVPAPPAALEAPAATEPMATEPKVSEEKASEPKASEPQAVSEPPAADPSLPAVPEAIPAAIPAAEPLPATVPTP